jgi:hypothetical protein
MMEAVSTSETSVNIYETRNIPEDIHLHTRRRENLKSYHVRHSDGMQPFSKRLLGEPSRMFKDCIKMGQENALHGCELDRIQLREH